MAIDPDKVHEFVNKAVGDLGAALGAALVVIGDKLGLYKALAEAGPRPRQSSPSAPAPTSATSASGSPRRPPPATSTTTPRRDATRSPPEQAACLTDEDSPACVLGGFQAWSPAIRADAAR